MWFSIRLGRLAVWHAVIVLGVGHALSGVATGQDLPASTEQGGSTGPAVAGSTPAGRGGGAAADFDTLIDLIQSTVAADTWLDNGTGEGMIQPFGLNGVYVDAAGSLQTIETLRADVAGARAAGTRPEASRSPETTQLPAEADPRRPSRLRMISLPQLEQTIVASREQGGPLDESVLTLAGLQRVAYVLVYPETGDLVLAGPAGDWQADQQGRLISLATGQPIVRLDDLLTLWRRQEKYQSRPFGCSINPRQAALADTQQFLSATGERQLEPGERGGWLAALRNTLGHQDVEYFNIDRDTRVAGVLLAADYHMKLIGMGLAEGSDGVESYLATVRLDEQGTPPPMAVLRWWFSLPASQVVAADERRAFQLPRRSVQVQSENELLAAQGKRVATGQSEPLNRRFAKSFTAEYETLGKKYPIYAELQRIFELTLALALIEREGLDGMAGWRPTLFLDAEALPLPKAVAVRSVETVVNHRVLRRRHIIAGVSGGVWLDPGQRVEVSTHQSPVERPTRRHRSSGRWWWDAEQP